MDADRFDVILRSLSQSPSRRAALCALAGAVLGGALAPAIGLGEIDAARKGGKKGQGGKKGGRKGKKGKKGKVVICHNGQTITVSESALKAHLKHNDQLGACAGDSPPPGPTCGALFATCTVGTDCCSGVCFPIADPDPDKCGCIAFDPDPGEGTCTTNASCCSGTCDAGECTCHEAGDICSDDAQCCPLLTCEGEQDIGGGILIGTCQ